MSSDDPMDRIQPERQQPSGIQRVDIPSPPPASERGAEPPGGGAPAPPQSPPGSRSSSKVLLRVTMLLVLAMGGWYFFGHTGGKAAGSEEDSPMYQKQKLGPSVQPAALAAADIDRLRTDSAREAAVRGDPIPGISNPTQEFLQAVKDGKVTFYAIRLYDTCFEDGDVVTLRLGSGADVGPVSLTNAGTTTSVPVVAGQPPQATLIGVHDGTGGITVGVQTSGGMWYSGVIPEGGTETLPLAVR